MNELDKVIREIRESAYGDGELGAGHPASIDDDKRAIKKVFLDLFKEVEYDQFEFVSKLENL